MDELFTELERIQCQRHNSLSRQQECNSYRENGKKSSSKRKKHIAIRYYFITDRVKADDLNIEYCPTRDMVADYFTNPLQGKKLYQFRKEMMNLKD